MDQQEGGRVFEVLEDQVSEVKIEAYRSQCSGRLKQSRLHAVGPGALEGQSHHLSERK